MSNHLEAAQAAIASHTEAFSHGLTLGAHLASVAAAASTNDVALAAENADAVAAVDAMQAHLADATAQLQAFAAQYGGTAGAPSGVL